MSTRCLCFLKEIHNLQQLAPVAFSWLLDSVAKKLIPMLISGRPRLHKDIAFITKV